MVDLVHLSLDAIVVVGSLGLSLYCFRLLNNFFKGGIFEASIKTLLASGLLFATGAVFDMLAEAFEFKLLNLHIVHIIIEILFVVTIFYGIRQLYVAWSKLGPR